VPYQGIESDILMLLVGNWEGLCVEIERIESSFVSFITFVLTELSNHKNSHFNLEIK